MGTHCPACPELCSEPGIPQGPGATPGNQPGSDLSPGRGTFKLGGQGRRLRQTTLKRRPEGAVEAAQGRGRHSRQKRRLQSSQEEACWVPPARRPLRLQQSEQRCRQCSRRSQLRQLWGSAGVGGGAPFQRSREAGGEGGNNMMTQALWYQVCTLYQVPCVHFLI